jgi:hypothetical protein
MANLSIYECFQAIVNRIVEKNTYSCTVQSLGNNLYKVYAVVKDLKNGMFVELTGFNEIFKVSNVKQTSFEISTPINITSSTQYKLALYFLYGNTIEIANTLNEKDYSNTYKYKKYPCIVLYTDNINTEIALFEAYTLYILILANTKHDFKTYERINNVYKPVLYPILDIFFDYVKNYELFSNIEPLEYSKKDTFFLANMPKEQNTLSAIVDAIEINNLKINKIIINCNK